MRKFTTNASKNPLLKPNPNPNPNPISNPNTGSVRQPYDSSGGFRFRQIDHHTSSAPAPTSSPNRKAMGLIEPRVSSQGYVTFNVGSFSRKELKELKMRLRSELEQVRALMSRIESGSCHSLPKGAEKNPKANLKNYQESELVAGKGKKKKKKDVMSVVAVDSKGTKRSNPFGGVMADPKRPAIDPISEKLVASMLKRCGQILTKLMKHKFGWVFNAPVDVDGLKLHDYHQIVKNPMDLGTVKSKLEKDLYPSPLDFASDVRLAFNNALLYNPKGSDVNFMAEQLLLQFNQMFNPAYKKFEDERRRVLGFGDPNVAPENARREIDTMVAVKKPDLVRSKPTFPDPPPLPPVHYTQALTKPSVPAPAPSPVSKPPLVNSRPVKLPKPKAKDPNKRQMTYEEKAKLGANLQNLPTEKMVQLLHILKKRNGQCHLSQDGEEIELDIEAVDTETLWELDRFVGNYKKMVSKIKRQALMQAQNPAPQNTDRNTVKQLPLLVLLENLVF